MRYEFQNRPFDATFQWQMDKRMEPDLAHDPEFHTFYIAIQGGSTFVDQQFKSIIKQNTEILTYASFTVRFITQERLKALIIHLEFLLAPLALQ